MVLLGCLLFIATQNIIAQNSFKLVSQHLAKTDSTWVFLPTNYTKNSEKKYPLLFMLHGWSGNYKQWNQITDLQSYANKYGFIIVCPDGVYDSWYVNSPAKPTQQYESYFFEDLLPYLLQNYSIDKEKIFITGLSMGGYGAFSLFFKHSEIFKGVAASSALFHPSWYAKRFGLTQTLGNDDSKTWQKYTLTEQLKTWKNNKTAKQQANQEVIFFDCGKGDAFLQSNITFETACKELHIPHNFITLEGGHDKAYWKKSVKLHFEFFKKLHNK